MIELVDSHCHLSSEEFNADNGASVIARAHNAGVATMVTIATTREDFEDVKRTVDLYENVYGTVGIHPEVANSPATFEELVAAVKHPKIVAIGETGLDYHYDSTTREEQDINFRPHIKAAIATDLPLIIHSREAEEDTIKIVDEESRGHEGKLTGVLHCFSSRKMLADAFLERGFYISLSGILTFKRSDELRTIAKDIPMDRLLVETDSPYLAPQSRRGKTCEPAFVVETAQMLADIKNVSLEELAAQTTANFFRLFSKAVQK